MSLLDGGTGESSCGQDGTDLGKVSVVRAEARVVAALRHLGIVQVHDFDVEGDDFYMVMEFIPGQSLYKRLTTLHDIGQQMPLDEALTDGALGLFQERYEDRVRVYAVGDLHAPPKAQLGVATFSKEICAGPHAERTSELGRFRITKEQSASSGVRRIRAVLE